MGIKLEQKDADLAQGVRSAWEVVFEESGKRVSEMQQRRTTYREVRSSLPYYGGLILPGSVRPAAKHQLKLGQMHRATVKLVGKLLAEAPVSHVPARSETEQERHRADVIKSVLAAVHHQNRFKVVAQSLAWHGSTLSAGVVRFSWDTKKNFPQYRSVKPENVFVKVAADDATEWEYLIYSSERSLASVAAKWGRDPGDFIADRVEDGTGREYVQVLDYWDEGAHVISAGKVVLKREVNRYGFIPYVIFRNVGPEEYVWGFSDAEFYEGLAAYQDSLVSQHADVIKTFANPPIFAKRTGFAASEILDVFRTGGVIATNKEDAEVSVIASAGAPPDLNTQNERVTSALEEATFSGPSARAGLSGTAVMELAAAQDALMAMKKANFEVALQKLNEYILRAIEKLGSGKMEFTGVDESGVRARTFYLALSDTDEMPNPEDVLAEAANDPSTFAMEDEEILRSRAPKNLNYRTLIDTYYQTRIVWQNRSKKEDPQYRLGMLNQFAQGALSLRTLLEETGVEDVEREIERIKQENQEMPWLRPQVMMAQAKQQEAMLGGGQPAGAGPAPNAAGGGGQVDPFDAATQGLNGSEGTSRAAGGPMGMMFGGA